MINLKAILFTVLLINCIACSKNNNNNNKGKLNMEIPKITKPVENIVPAADQQKRRANSEAMCKEKGIKIYENPNSLFVSSEGQTNLRTQNEVVDRAMALLYIALKGEGMEQDTLDEINETYDISPKLSPNEKEYFLSKNPTDQQKVNASWRYESLHVLLWSLGYVKELDYPDNMCDVGADVKLMYDMGPEKFRAQAQLKSKKEILDQADLILRFHWACVNARINEKEAPGNLNSSVIFERHYALNWLIRYDNQNWDQISTDT